MAIVDFPPVTVILADGTPLKAEIWPADLYRLEERANVSLANIGKGFSFRELLPLTWFALRRAGQIPIEWTVDDFVNKVKDIDIDDPAAPKDTAVNPFTG